MTAAAPAAGAAFEALDREVFARLTREEGIDAATIYFLEAARSCPRNGTWMREVDALSGLPPPLLGHVVIVPAGCYREYPQIGADGRLIREAALEAGLTVETAPITSRGPVTENARILQTLIRERPAGAAFASLSKGGAELRLALEWEPGLATRIGAWVQICGLIHGSPAVDSLLGRRGLGRIAVQGVTAATGVTVAMRELRHASGSLLSAPFRAPDGLPVINVVACPLARHVGTSVRRRYAELSRLGPNDGSTLLADAVVRPGRVYPVWGADHYFRTPTAPGLIRRLLHHLYREGVFRAA